MKILVTGANGHLGGKIVASLAKKVTADQIAVGVRDTTSEKAQQFKAAGYEVRATDFENAESLTAAFMGIDRIFIVSTFGDYETVMRHQNNAIAAAKNAKVAQVVYPSVTRAEGNDFFLAQLHRAREVALIESGLNYVILRNNWYIENELNTIQGCLAGAPWVTAAGDGKVGWAYRPDLAEAAANVLTSEGHDNKVYELSGPNLTQQQFVDAVNAVTGKEIQVLNVSDEAYADMLKQGGVPEAYLPMLTMTQSGIRAGGLESVHSDLETLLNRPATSLQDALAQLLK